MRGDGLSGSLESYEGIFLERVPWKFSPSHILVLSCRIGCRSRRNTTCAPTFLDESVRRSVKFVSFYSALSVSGSLRYWRAYTGNCKNHLETNTGGPSRSKKKYTWPRSPKSRLSTSCFGDRQAWLIAVLL